MATIPFLSPVQELIPQVEERMRAQSRGHDSDLSAALDHLLSSGGKRIRPAVTLLIGGMLGAETDRMVTLAAAVELLHTANLVHDDLIDGSILRRGIPTINAHWSPAATVLTGDFIFARAAGLAADTHSVDVMKMFAETLSVIVNGEIIQLFSNRSVANRKDYYRRIHAKTASLFELAAAAAGLISPVQEETVKKVQLYGHEIGMAFQIVDDVLDYTGEQATVGKPVGSDLRQGLITLPAICYYETHPNDPDMKAFLNGNRHEEEQVERLVQSIRKSKAIDDSLAEARSFVMRGVDALIDLHLGIERQALEDLAYYIIERQK